MGVSAGAVTDAGRDNKPTSVTDDVTKKAVSGLTSYRRGAAHIITDIIIIGLLIGLDRFTKYLAVVNLKDKPSYVILDGVFEFSYLENRGAAFGIMQNMKYFFLVVAVLMSLFVLYSLIKIPGGKHFLPMQICLMLIGAGAIGNMIDRLTTEYVVDFFYFSLINFPIFNVADIYVTIACILLILSILFIYKEDDLSFLGFKKSSDA